MLNLDKFRQPHEIMDKIDFLQEVYVDYCKKHDLPLVSADEQDYNENHDAWFKNYIELWNYSQEVS